MRTSMKEVCEAMNWCLKQEYAQCWGTSSCQIMQAYDICEELKLGKPVVEQCQYNMFCEKKWKMNIEIFLKNKNGYYYF